MQLHKQEYDQGEDRVTALTQQEQRLLHSRLKTTESRISSELCLFVSPSTRRSADALDQNQEAGADLHSANVTSQPLPAFKQESIKKNMNGFVKRCVDDLWIQKPHRNLRILNL